MKKRSFVGLKAMLLCILLVWFAWNIWPTPFQLIIVGTEAYRINRITGIRQTSTAHGWMTEEEIQAEAQRRFAKEEQDRIEMERRADQARVEQARRDNQAREEQARRDSEARVAQARQQEETNSAIIRQVRHACEGIQVDDARNLFNQVAILNPSHYDLHSTIPQNTTLEYYRTNVTETEEHFLCKGENQQNYDLNGETPTEITVGATDTYGRGWPYEVAKLPSGTFYTQKITLTFDDIKMPCTDGTTTTIMAVPPITIRFRRLFKK